MLIYQFHKDSDSNRGVYIGAILIWTDFFPKLTDIVVRAQICEQNFDY